MACSVTGCERYTKGNRKLCSTHSVRLSRTGSLELKPRDISTRGTVKYHGAHRRCDRLWGRAKEHLCIKCGNQAEDWAYDGTDATELSQDFKTYTVKYSIYPEFYMPLCKPCHGAQDSSDTCKNGHKLEEGNIYWTSTLPTLRKCKICTKAHQRAYNARKSRKARYDSDVSDTWLRASTSTT